VTHQLDEYFALSTALAAKAAHDLVQVVLQLRGLRLQRGGAGGVLLRDV
jgi:hypothetical protein